MRQKNSYLERAVDDAYTYGYSPDFGGLREAPNCLRESGTEIGKSGTDNESINVRHVTYPPRTKKRKLMTELSPVAAKPSTIKPEWRSNTCTNRLVNEEIQISSATNYDVGHVPVLHWTQSSIPRVDSTSASSSLSSQRADETSSDDSRSLSQQYDPGEILTFLPLQVVQFGNMRNSRPGFTPQSMQDQSMAPPAHPIKACSRTINIAPLTAQPAFYTPIIPDHAIP